ncbi:hypothetical protein LCGC14_1580820 [marine sediment metagenome]|uniref:N-acetyltransferase domain-containing protein n=1 Tax=marine sediment metagenome TaxID=412755 RepID=A0A0F9IH36_9ZZZZ
MEQAKCASVSNMRLRVVPTTLRKANDFVEKHHRHNGRTARNGGKFAIAAAFGDDIVGVAIVGNPISATYMDGFTAEVLRTCVDTTAPRNTNSFLYGACWRVWRNMGGLRLLTYTLQTESGVSLRAAGFCLVGKTRPTEPGWRKRDHLDRAWQPVMGVPKFRWEKTNAETRGGKVT